MTLYHPHEKEQLTAINYSLRIAPQIQKQLKEKFGYGENMFFDLDLIEYRIHNSRKDIAQDLDVKSLYGIIGDRVNVSAAGSAFRGHHDKEFLPEYQFEGLFGEQLNDLIEESRHSITGKIYGQKGYAKGLGKLTAEERLENTRKGNLARGARVWTLAELVSLHEIREESVGKGLYKTKPCMTYVTEKFNEQHGTELNKEELTHAYFRNKNRLSEAGVEIAEPFIWTLDKILSLHEIREESVGEGFFKTKPCINYVTEKFNEQHGTDLTKKQLTLAYSRNKHRLSED